MLFLTSVMLSWAALASPGEHRNDQSSSSWEQTLEGIVPAVVALRVTGTRDFDTESAQSSTGTGFVVDAERGLILTNRHMVHAGPVLAEAVFHNHEEVELTPIYRDPVHDFGFYRFDPADVQFTDVVGLSLAPEQANVGMEVRVVGNDAGEKLSILDGTIARLDRGAPVYGGNTYNDFNTFYIQAASNTSGGSSGSPVVAMSGQAVGLNAGGRKGAASSFYLPLDRVVRALSLIQQDQPVTRGTIQTVFAFTPFDEVSRLGLSDSTAATIRGEFPQTTGMLVVDQVVPLGPAWDQLAPGDILVRVGGELTIGFVELEAVLDENPGKEVTLQIERSGELLDLTLPVGDLHEITPAEYLELGRGVFHTLSYQQARNHVLPVGGVYTAIPGYAFAAGGVPEGAIIVALDGAPVPDLDSFQAALEDKADGERMRVRWHSAHDPRHMNETVVGMDRAWFPMRRCVRNDVTGAWPCTEAPPPPATRPPPARSTMLSSAGPKAARILSHSLVIVDFDVPHPTGGVKDFNYVGTGVVVNAELGLVLVDRDTVPVALGDIVITFGGSVRVPAEMVYLHPIHNYAVVRYDPTLIAGTPVRSITFAPRPPSVGDPMILVALNRSHEVVSTETKVERFDALHIGVSPTPRFRDSNVEGIDVTTSVPSLGGVLADKKGRVYAQWASFLDQKSGERTFHGLPAAYITHALTSLAAGQVPEFRSVGAEFTSLSMADARERGLSEDRAQELFEADSRRRKVLEVARLTGGTPAFELLRDRDILLEADGIPVTRLSQIELLSRREKVQLLVLRDAKEELIELPTVPLSGQGVDRVVSWAGAVLHEPHSDVAAQKAIVADGLYVAWVWYGSPASRYQLRPTRRIVAVDGKPTPNLEAFLAAIEGQEDRQAIQMKTVALDGQERVETMKLDLRYWPSQVFERANGHWNRTTVGE